MEIESHIHIRIRADHVSARANHRGGRCRKSRPGGRDPTGRAIRILPLQCRRHGRAPAHHTGDHRYRGCRHQHLQIHGSPSRFSFHFPSNLCLRNCLRMSFAENGMSPTNKQRHYFVLTAFIMARVKITTPFDHSVLIVDSVGIPAPRLILGLSVSSALPSGNPGANIIDIPTGAPMR